MYARWAISVACAVLSCLPSYGGDVPHSKFVVNGERAKSFVAHLSTDAMEGRMSCTEGYRKAADWVAAKFSSWGLKPAGEEGTYFQEVTMRGRDWRTGVPTGPTARCIAC